MLQLESRVSCCFGSEIAFRLELSVGAVELHAYGNAQVSSVV